VTTTPNAVKKSIKDTAASKKTSKQVVNGLKKTLSKVQGKGKKLSATDRRALKAALQELQDRVLGEISFLTDDGLNRSKNDPMGETSLVGMHMADHGTENFDREFALNLVSAEHDVLYEINEALRRLDDNRYGECESCGCRIEKARLEALPFARLCIRCKSAQEKGAIRYRPLGPTLSKR
jgi:RNA polymerase-binding transcription factor DksA